MQSIGERLEEARKRKGVTIREAAEATKIRGDYLNSFENNNFTINVPDIYVRGFLRSYCNFLKLNSDKIVTDFNAQLMGEAKGSKREHREFFGRMELQQPLVAEEPNKAAAPNEPSGGRPQESDESAPENFLDRIDKEVAIKVGIIAVAALLLILLIIWAFRAIVGGDPAPSAQDRQGSATQMVPSSSAEAETIRLIATGDVRVTVIETQTGKELLSDHPLSDGQSVEVTKRGPARIVYTAGENLLVEVGGTEYETGKTGAGYNTIN